MKRKTKPSPGSDPSIEPAGLQTAIYHGFVVVPETYIEGWVLGEISEYIGNEIGDGFVVAPDGSRAGLVWEIGEGELQQILPPDKERWGVYAIWFPHEMRTMADVVRNFHSVLPILKQQHARVHAA